MVLGGSLRDSKGELTCSWALRLQTENGPEREEQTEEKEEYLGGVSGARLVWARTGEQWSGIAECRWSPGRTWTTAVVSF